jgi:hypothetical protein
MTDLSTGVSDVEGRLLDTLPEGARGESVVSVLGVRPTFSDLIGAVSLVVVALLLSVGGNVGLDESLDRAASVFWMTVVPFLRVTCWIAGPESTTMQSPSELLSSAISCFSGEL